MTGTAIAAEIEAAYREVAREVGGGAFTVTLIEPAAQPTNPWDSPAGSPTEHDDIPALRSTIPSEWIDGTLIRADDEMIKIAGTAPEPKLNWRVSYGGVTYMIQAIKEFGPSGVVLNYGLVLRA